jgi:hypothetical protein
MLNYKDYRSSHRHLKRIFESKIDDIVDSLIDLEDSNLVESVEVLDFDDQIQKEIKSWGSQSFIYFRGGWWDVMKDYLTKTESAIKFLDLDNSYEKVSVPIVKSILKESKKIIQIRLIYKFPFELTFFNASDHRLEIEERKNIIKSHVSKIESITDYKSIQEVSFIAGLGAPEYYYGRDGFFVWSEIYFYK